MHCCTSQTCRTVYEENTKKHVLLHIYMLHTETEHIFLSVPRTELWKESIHKGRHDATRETWDSDMRRNKFCLSRKA